MITHIDGYCDGGVVGRNPSFIAGVATWIIVVHTDDGNKFETRGEAIIRPNRVEAIASKQNGLPSVTNNDAELFAGCSCALEMLRIYIEGFATKTGIHSVDDITHINLHMDSNVTISRMSSPNPWIDLKNVYAIEIYDSYCRYFKEINKVMNLVKVAGHATPDELIKGYRVSGKKKVVATLYNTKCDDYLDRMKSRLTMNEARKVANAKRFPVLETKVNQAEETCVQEDTRVSEEEGRAQAVSTALHCRQEL